MKNTLRDVKSFGIDAFPCAADLSTPQGVEALFEAASTHFDRSTSLSTAPRIFKSAACWK